MNNPSSPLDTLRQLKEMLDAGALTPTEFEALKQRLVFSETAEAPAPPAAPLAERPSTPTPPEPIALTPTPPVAPSPPTFTELRSPSVDQGPPASVPPVVPPIVVPPRPAPPVTPVFTEVPSPPPPPVVPPAAYVPPVSEPAPDENAGWVADEFPESERPAARSPLALILSIGGLLALLSLVVYLSLNRPPSERISSTSLTAADSVAAPIETGPQAEQLTLPVEAAPETIRVVPSNPAPPLPARPAPAARDSTPAPAPAPTPAAADTVGP